MFWITVIVLLFLYIKIDEINEKNNRKQKLKDISDEVPKYPEPVFQEVDVQAPDLYPGSDQWYKDKTKYLKSSLWQKIKKERLELDGYQCCSCWTTDEPLEIHHLTYDRLGCEQMKDLRSLCRECHQEQHDHYGYFTEGFHPII